MDLVRGVKVDLVHRWVSEGNTSSHSGSEGSLPLAPTDSEGSERSDRGCLRGSPLSHSGILPTRNVNYTEKEKGQTLKFEDLSLDAPLGPEILNLWIDFKKVVKFIDDNASWLKPSMASLMMKKK